MSKARNDLEEARKIEAIGLATVAARSAYYAAFHAAEAFIMERTGKIVKTHSGVRTEFARLAKDTPGIDRRFTNFLAKAYMYKEIGDYAVGPDATVTPDAAKAAIVVAEEFIDCIAAVLTK
nr:HEPN domain-containing protein [Rhodoblastus sphagnicola]